MFANTVLQSTALPQALSCSPSDFVQNSSIGNLCHVCKHCASVNCITPSSFMFSLGFGSKLFDWKSVSYLPTLCFSQLYYPKLFHVRPRILFKTLRLEICVMFANTVLQSTALSQALSCSPSDFVQNSSIGNLCHVCKHCASGKFQKESPGMCCYNGKKKIDPYHSLTNEFMDLYSGSGRSGGIFIKILDTAIVLFK
ncbi:hypothetical protein RRG08_019769 [Elysia crispata]|uniref:Uncharacterized protein n=1 Tax=Elysia crispata TaxID=231223 RepID=A0AAE1AWJ4_9GAST|nr:hypothetical protein RRG08_019769 [Elysia crispata]